MKLSSLDYHVLPPVGMAGYRTRCHLWHCLLQAMTATSRSETKVFHPERSSAARHPTVENIYGLVSSVRYVQQTVVFAYEPPQM